MIYKVNNDDFEMVYINEIADLNPDEYQSLVKVCSILVDKKDWYWVQVCANFLLNAGDPDIKNQIQNYANGQFTQEEIELHKNSDITKEDMQLFSKQLLNE